jgi:hypothetical protein
MYTITTIKEPSAQLLSIECFPFKMVDSFFAT